MANSVVKVTDVADDPVSDSLLLLVGEDGNITPDRQTVDKYLNSASGPTNIQIMHIDKCDHKSIDVTVDNVIYMPDNMDVVNEEDVTAKDGSMQDVDIVAINLHNVKLDHDYTSWTSPKRASPVHDDDDDDEDELTNTLSIIHGSGQAQRKSPKSLLVTVPSKAPRGIKILSSISIPAPNSSTKSVDDKETPVCDKPTPVIIKGKAKVLHTSSKIQPIKKEGKPGQTNVQKDESSDEEQEDKGDDDDEDESEYEELDAEDDDNDSDFDIQEEITRAKGKKASKKSKSDNEALNESTNDPPPVTPDSKISKSEASDATKPDCISKQGKGNETQQSGEISTDKSDDKAEDSSTDQKTDAGQEVKAEEAKPPEKKHPKKKKEPPKPIPGDFALFSTPDIIRKVGGKDPETPTGPKGFKGFDHSKPQAPLKIDALTALKPGKITQESRSKSTTEISSAPSKQNRLSLDEKERSDKEKHNLHQRTSSTEAKSKDRRDSVEKHKTPKAVEEKRKSEQHNPERRSSDSSSERGTSLPEGDRKISDSCKSTPKTAKNLKESQEISAQDIRAIIMNEDTKTYTTNTIPIPNAPVQVVNNPDPSHLHLDASGLDLDQSILDNINNDMISEDILYQVAKQLVSNTELQNAIDKGINEGVLDTSGIQEAIDISSQISQGSNNSSFSGSQHSDVIKEGTQIVRPDGSILVLPPIERPTTRSRNKRKEEVAKPSFKQPPVKVDNRSKDRPAHKPLDEEHVSGNELDSSDEEESEDDPNKLWCICNQPHNNRFMICCDTCEEWYHGKCVNITKAMGQQMESEGKEWICLFCKDPALKRPMAAARRIRKASRNSNRSNDSNNSAKKNEKGKKATSMPCVVCQRPSRKNSIYCSETCILTHAQGIERVVVFERSTGNMLTGSKAPSATNLDQWLKEHPGYEVVRSAGKVVTTKVKPGNFTQSKLKIVKNPNNQGVSVAVQQRGVNIGVMSHSPKHLVQTNQEQGSTSKAPKMIKVITKAPVGKVGKDSKIKLIHPQPMPTVLKPKEPTPTRKIQVQTTLTPPPTSPIVKIPKKETPKKEPPKDNKTPKNPKPKTKDDAPTPQSKAEDIRDNVQKTIFEQLLVRLKGSDIKLTDEAVKNISIEIETELYKCFGDTGQKYKNKYRSLIFNIKDPKNQTLWRRICEKSISSYELVRLSPDDMASQELAKWREQEAKHQLDMIKKSEIELLNCNRQYVLKTHKGEEVLEDNTIGNKADNTEIIKSLTEGSTLDTDAEMKRNNSKDRDKSRDKRSSSKHSHKEKNRDKGRHLSRDRRDKEHKSRRSSSHDRSRSRKRSRSKERQEKKKDKRSRSRSRDERERSKEREKYRKSSNKASRHKKSGNTSSTDSLDKRSKEILEQLNKIAPPVEDRLWKHVPQDDIVPGNAPMDSDSDHEVPTSTVTIPTPPRTQELEEIPSQLSIEGKTVAKLKETEPNDDKGGSPPAKELRTAMQIWSGTINMVDVAKISITAHEVSGDCSGLSKELSASLDIVGRISPDTVWDYIGKMRSSNSKVISLIRLNATNIEEQMPYLALYSYLSSRNRLGVVKSTNKSIKDFYILPLAAQKPIPQALLPISGPGFEEARPALLLGIIVRDRRKRSYLDIMPVTVTPHKKTRVEVHVVQTQPARSYTPPPMSADLTPTPPPIPPSPKLDPRLAKHAAPPLPPAISAVPEMVPPPLPSLSSPSLMSKLSPLIMSIVNPPKSSTPPLRSKPIEAEKSNDDDEPYSPEDFDPEASLIETPSPSLNMSVISELSITQATVTTEPYMPIPGLGGDSDLSAKKLDIQRQMEELNKQIEQQKSEITSITKNIATAESEIVGSALASIALPSNLQQILDSIKTIGTTSSGDTISTSTKESSTPSNNSDLTIPLIIPKTFSRPFISVPPPDLSANTIPLNLPVKSKLTPPQTNSPLPEEKPSSVLSTLSEEDLIKKAAEMLNEEESVDNKKITSPPAPKLSFQPPKKSKIQVSLPPVPGVDD